MSGELWSTATVLGPIILILAFGFALFRRRKLSTVEKEDQKDAVRDIYRGGSGGPSAPHTPGAPKPEKDG